MGNDSNSSVVGNETTVGEWFGQEIRKLDCGGDMVDLDGAYLCSFTDKMVLDFNVLGAGMHDGIVHKADT